MRRLAYAVLGLVLFLVLGIALLIFIFNEAKPTGTTGPEADALATRMITWTQQDAWKRTGAIRWKFGGRFDHLWDRQRGYDRVSWGPYVVLLRTHDRTGIARADGVVVSDDRAKDLLAKAYERWINDGFWLNPFDGLLASKIERRIVESERGPGLMVTYPSGGVTPGDSYVWFADAEGRPTAWKMWVSIIPIGGLETSWDDWVTLPTGAKVSTLHRGPIDLRVEDVQAAATLAELLDGEPDPFAELLTEAPSAASQPAAP